jgi:hypothetical protein
MFAAAQAFIQYFRNTKHPIEYILSTPSSLADLKEPMQTESNGERNRSTLSGERNRSTLSGERNRSTLSGERNRSTLSGERNRSTLSGESKQPNAIETESTSPPHFATR